MSELYWQRWANARANMKLAAVLPSGIPVKRFRAEVLVHIVTAYKLLNQYVLLSIANDLRDSKSIADFLGIQPELASEAMAEELVAGTISAGGDKKYYITEIGDHVLENFKTLESRTESFQLFKDLVTGKLTDATSISKRKPEPFVPGEFKGPYDFPAIDRKKIDAKAIDLFRLNEILGLNNEKKVIKVNKTKLEPADYYKEAFALVYVSNDQSRFAIDVVIDDEISEAHSELIDPDAFIATYALEFDTPVPPPSLPEALSEARLFEPAAIDKISLAIQDVEIIDSIDPELEASPAPGMFIGQQSAPSRVTVFEHTTILDNALNFAKNRLMIFSPWIKGGVVNRSFLRKLETLLIRGVEVYIVYGIGEAEDNSQWCLDKLCELSSRFPAFQFYRHQNTHAKAFIVDDCVIQTSFNWLSFAGDENRTYRMEEGMKYIGATVADPWFDAYSKLLEHEAELACS